MLVRELLEQLRTRDQIMPVRILHDGELAEVDDVAVAVDPNPDKPAAYYVLTTVQADQ